MVVSCWVARCGDTIGVTENRLIAMYYGVLNGLN